VKAKEIDEERRVLAEYGSTDSGASLGNILGEAIQKKNEKSKIM
jgi:small subunit ribosomal protein S1